ncbi:MAG: flagellar hook-basal body complex protein FliE [Provencibacterium sp.]|nr:flagellar hook-basal body complex protein FliE [Provencibacterium sp.]
MFIVPITRLAPMETQAGREAVSKPDTSSLPFADVLESAISEYRQAEAVSQADAHSLASGSVENLADVMINSLRLSTAIELTTQITTRAVSAYKEVMQMQV